MATKTAKKAATKPATKTQTKKWKAGKRGSRKLPLTLKNLAVGLHAVAIGFEIDRGVMDIEEAEPLLVGARVKVTLSLEDLAQTELFEGSIVKLEEKIADIHRIGVGVASLTGRFTFRRNSVPIDTLVALAQHQAQAVIERVGDVGEEKDGGGNGAGAGEPHGDELGGAVEGDGGGAF